MRKILFIFMLIFTTASFAQIEYNIAINEICISSENKKSWIELYNHGDSEVSFKEAYLSDNISSPKKWKFKQSKTLQPYSFYVFYLDSADFHEFDITEFKGESLYLHIKSGSSIDFVDDFKFKNRTEAKYCRVPDGLGKVFNTNESTPFKINQVREFLNLQLAPNISSGVTWAKFNQTNTNFKVRPGFTISRGMDFNIFLWERYRMVFGVNYSNFRYSYTSAGNVVEKGNVRYRDNTTGYERTRWVDIKLPLAYNSFRVHDNFFVDIGFLMSVKNKENSGFDVERSFLNEDNTVKGIINSSDTKTELEEDEFAFKAPFIFRVSYQKQNLEIFSTYYLRKDQDNETTGDKRNSKPALSVGVVYNFSFLRLR